MTRNSLEIYEHIKEQKEKIAALNERIECLNMIAKEFPDRGLESLRQILMAQRSDRECEMTVMWDCMSASAARVPAHFN